MTVSIVNHKGGTGKTTTTINLGAALSAMGFKVLLVDLDSQANLTYSFGIHDDHIGIDEVLMSNANIRESIQKREGMDIVPSNRSLADAESTMAKIDNSPTYLKSALSNCKKYDVVLIDCPPSISLLTVNALYASDQVIIPIQLDVLSIRGLELVLQTIGVIQETINEDLKILGLLPVMVDFRKNLSREILEYVKSNFKERILSSRIRTSVRVSEAPSFGESLFQYAPGCNVAQDYTQLANEFVTELGLVPEMQKVLV